MRKLSTELSDRTLRFDGVSILDPERVAAALARGVRPSDLRVTSISDDVRLHNEVVVEADRLRELADEPVQINMAWRLPKKYQDLDLNQYVIDRFVERSEELGFTADDSDVLVAEARIQAELAEIQRRGMVEFMKTVIYVLDTFRQNNVVWGVGRGSSCASYVLFIIGLHVVDSLKLQVPMEEFFHD